LKDPDQIVDILGVETPKLSTKMEAIIYTAQWVLALLIILF
jgi:hypothetical protein